MNKYTTFINEFATIYLYMWSLRLALINEIMDIKLVITPKRQILGITNVQNIDTVIFSLRSISLVWLFSFKYETFILVFLNKIKVGELKATREPAFKWIRF